MTAAEQAAIHASVEAAAAHLAAIGRAKASAVSGLAPRTPVRLSLTQLSAAYRAAGMRDPRAIQPPNVVQLRPVRSAHVPDA
jgi:hypothetical protein